MIIMITLKIKSNWDIESDGLALILTFLITCKVSVHACGYVYVWLHKDEVTFLCNVCFA